MAIIIIHLILAGSSLITKKMGQTLVSEDLKSDTPSVLSTKDILAGFVVGHKNPPRLESWRYSVPSYISFNVEVLEIRFFRVFIIFQNSLFSDKYGCEIFNVNYYKNTFKFCTELLWYVRRNKFSNMFLPMTAGFTFFHRHQTAQYECLSVEMWGHSFEK